MNSFAGKRLLALVRGGDYAHAGEEEAIELAFRAVPKAPQKSILDVGCGRGGTIAFLRAADGVKSPRASIARAIP